MTYTVGQIAQPNSNDPSDNPVDSIYMKIFKNAEAIEMSFAGVGLPDKAVQLTDGTLFLNNVPYFFHGKIKREETENVFNVYLVKGAKDGEIGSTEKRQFVAMVTVPIGTGFEDVAFSFMPYESEEFDTIIFKKSYSNKGLMPGDTNDTIIAYIEISSILNRLGEGKAFKRIGVQSRPGLRMCLNKEEIFIGRSGIYELHNGIITINFFSVVTEADFTSPYDYNSLTECKYLGNSVNIRPIPAYILDYMEEK